MVALFKKKKTSQSAEFWCFRVFVCLFFCLAGLARNGSDVKFRSPLLDLWLFSFTHTWPITHDFTFFTSVWLIRQLTVTSHPQGTINFSTENASSMPLPQLADDVLNSSLTSVILWLCFLNMQHKKTQRAKMFHRQRSKCMICNSTKCEN